MTTDNKALADRVKDIADSGQALALTASEIQALTEAAAALTATPSAQAGEENRYVFGQLMHWSGIPVRVYGACSTHPNNWPLIDPGAQELLADGWHRDGDVWTREPQPTTPQPQGDASPEVSGEMVDRARNAYKATKRWSTGNYPEGSIMSAGDLDANDDKAWRDALKAAAISTPRAHEPAPTADGGAVERHCPGCGKETRITRGAGGTKYAAPCMDCMQWRSPFHPAPQADVARLEAALKEAESRVVSLEDGIEKALEEIEDAGPKALKYAAQELHAAMNQGATNGQE